MRTQPTTTTAVTTAKRPILAIPVDTSFVIRDFRQEMNNYARLDNFIQRPFKVAAKTPQELAFTLGVKTNKFTMPILYAIVQSRKPNYLLKLYANQIFNTK